MLRPSVDQFIHHCLPRVDLHDAPAFHTVLGAGACPQEPQEVVDLRSRADRRAAARRGVLLLDGDRRRNALDAVHQRLRHPLEELFGIRRERLDVTALALGVEGIERERALARPRWSGDDREGAPRQLDGDRKSTRLNSSHGYISYAVFCLKKKKSQACYEEHTT